MGTGGYTSNSGYDSSADEKPSSGPNYDYPFALAGLIAGVMSLFFNPFFLPSAIGVLAGSIGLRHALARRTPEGRKPGFGVAVAALVLSSLGLAGSLFLTASGILT
ncbi:DUF4190 domain-containing protein [Herbiconiux sp. P15]|uniref:DUF4190 domain-containing protein n=1 Tax=Herbiconiux liukaitaii TaxID=3342799 RepID=UPI0035B96D78